MRRLLIISLVFLGVQASAQVEWVYSMQALNLYDGNAAAAGMYDRTSVNVRYRQQWAGVEGAPETFLLTANTSFGALGGGLRLRREQLGSFERTLATMDVSYKLDMRQGELRFALGGGMRHERLDVGSMLLSDGIDDPVINAEAQLAPLVNAALMYRNDRFFLGVEANHLMAQSRRIRSDVTIPVEAMLILGSQHQLNEMLSIRPMAALRYADNGALLPELQLGAWWKKTIWFGTGYRWDTEAYAFMEYRLRRKVRFAYGVGLPAVAWAPGALNHEVMVGWIVGRKERSVESIRNFQ